MRSMPLFLAAMVLAGGGTASAKTTQTPEQKLERLLKGRVAGNPVNCIGLRNAESSQIIDRTAIVYRSGGTLYVNRPRIGADALDDNVILVTRITGSQLCSIDLVDLIDRNSHFQRGSVSLGEFVPYRKPG